MVPRPSNTNTTTTTRPRIDLQGEHTWQLPGHGEPHKSRHSSQGPLLISYDSMTLSADSQSSLQPKQTEEKENMLVQYLEGES